MFIKVIGAPRHTGNMHGEENKMITVTGEILNKTKEGEHDSKCTRISGETKKQNRELDGKGKIAIELYLKVTSGGGVKEEKNFIRNEKKEHR